MDVQELNQKRRLDIRCTFQYTLSEKCYVQLVSDVMDGYHEGVYLEGETEASHNFTGLLSGTYVILVHGLRGHLVHHLVVLTISLWPMLLLLNSPQILPFLQLLTKMVYIIITYCMSMS